MKTLVKEIQEAKVTIEATRRGYRFSLDIKGSDSLSMISYPTFKEATQAAEERRQALLEMVADSQ